MPKDISDYLSYNEIQGHAVTSVNLLEGTPLTIERWELCECAPGKGPSKGKFAGKRALVFCNARECEFAFYTASGVIMEQMDAVAVKKAELGETDMSFTCVIGRAGKARKLYSAKDWQSRMFMQSAMRMQTVGWNQPFAGRQQAEGGF